jgi:predicted PurR-regulated permease PerM
MGTALAEVWANAYVRVLVVVLAVLALLYLLFQTRIVWTSFLIAYLLAYIANPLIIWLQRRRVRRWLGVIIVFLIVVAALGLVIFLLGIMARQIQDFAQNLPALLEPLIEGDHNLFSLIEGVLPPGASEVVAGWLTQLPEQFAGFGGATLAWVGGLIGGVVQLFLILVFTIYIMLSFPHIGDNLLRFFPRQYRDDVERLGTDLMVKFDRSVGTYIRAQLLIAVAVGLMLWVSLSAAGIPLAASWAILGGAFNVIPFLGPIVASVPAVLLALLVGSWGLAFAVIVIIILINQIDGNVLTPILLSRVMELNPVTVMLSLLIGAALFGLVGALLAVPAVGFLKLLYQDYYLNSDWYQRRDEL